MSQKKQIIGKWIEEDGKVITDPACNIINHLIENHFVKIAERDDGWIHLYKDPINGTFWELSYPESELHGGGAPTLTQFSFQELNESYKKSDLDV